MLARSTRLFVNVYGFVSMAVSVKTKSLDVLDDTELWTADFIWLNFVHLFNALGYASMILLPVYLNHLGASRSEIGIVMAMGAVGGLLFRPMVGYALEQWGRRRTMQCATILMSLSFFLFIWIDSIGPVLYVDRLLFGIAEGALFSANFTFAADIIPTQRRTQGLALFGIAGLSALLVNPLTDVWGLSPPQLPMFFVCVGGLISLSLIFLMLIQAGDKPSDPQSIAWSQVLAILNHPRLWGPWMATISFAAMVSTFFAFATVSAEARGLSTPSTLWFTYVIGAVGVRLVGGHWADRYGPHNFIAPSIGMYVVAAIVMMEAQSLASLACVGLCAGVAHGMCFPLLTSQVVSRVSDDVRGFALALYTGLWEISALLGKPTMGAISDAYGDGVMFGALAMSGIVGLILWAWLEHRFA
jgi:predicted MFS family arabinose efflux permease